MDMLWNVVQRIMTSVSLDVIQGTSCTTVVPDPGHVHLMDGLETSRYVNLPTYIYSIYYFSYFKMQQFAGRSIKQIIQQYINSGEETPYKEL